MYVYIYYSIFRNIITLRFGNLKKIQFLKLKKPILLFYRIDFF